MVLREERLIFVHIPKCAGSSIELFFGVAPFDWRTPDYKYVVGWCPVRSLHMQHATPELLIESKLVPEDEFYNLRRFTVVRNPVDRAISDYRWLMKDTKIKDTFSNFLRATGKFKDVLGNRRIPAYRGDHLRAQTEYLKIQGNTVVNDILRFESLERDWGVLLRSLGMSHADLPHLKKNSNKPTRMTLDKRTFQQILDKYYCDFETLGYSTDYTDYTS